MIERLINKIFRRKYCDKMMQQKELLLLSGVWRELNGQVREDKPVNNVSGIVFSMDRPLQLHALLGSYRDLVRGHSKLTVIYRTTSSDYVASYDAVFQDYEGMIEVRRQENRQDFRSLLLEVLSETPADKIFFLVDDNMFVESVDLTFFAGMASMYCVPSLRMGKNLARSYTLNRSQPVPSLFPLKMQHHENLRAWIWKYGKLDWSYPLSVDGHFFLRKEILALAKNIDFDSPNHFEEKLQKFQGLFSWRLGVCYSKSRLINIPYNKVQTDIENLHGSVHQEDMLRMCQEGFRIDTKSYYGIVNESAHQEFPLRLKRYA